MNNMDPRTKPHGTPHVRGHDKDEVSYVLTVQEREERLHPEVEPNQVFGVQINGVEGGINIK